MKILISNDDGFRAKGLGILAETAREFGEVLVIAPEQNRSAASSSLTLSHSLYLRKSESFGYYYSNGTPADCIQIAFSAFPDFKPDMVLAGVNHGANLGNDVLYSGTVAVATEGFLRKINSFAFSVTSKGECRSELVRGVIHKILKKFRDNPFSTPKLLNINIPNLPQGEVVGYKLCHLGMRDASHCAVPVTSPRGEVQYWMGESGDALRDQPGSDFEAVENGFVSITELELDMTAETDHLEEWISDLD